MEIPVLRTRQNVKFKLQMISFPDCRPVFLNVYLF